MSVGYLTRQYRGSDTCRTLRGIVVDASLIWEATGLTTATLTASSRGDESVVAGRLRRIAARRRRAGRSRAAALADLDREGRLRLRRLCRRQHRHRSSARTRASLGSALTYKFNREFSLKGEYRYDQLHSNAAGVDYNASVFLVGLKLQR